MKFNALALISGLYLLAIAPAWADPAALGQPPAYADQLPPVHFRQASKPAQVFGCLNLGDFKSPDTARGAYQHLRALADAGLDTALIVGNDGGSVKYIAFRCAK